MLNKGERVRGITPLTFRLMFTFIIITAVLVGFINHTYTAAPLPETEADTFENRHLTITYAERNLRYGIDVSRHQGYIDWEKVSKTNIEFVMLRAGVGRIDDDNPISVDSRFREYIAAAQLYDIPVGVYFYSYAETVSEARKEARFLVRLLRKFDIDYPVVLDMERNADYYTDKPELIAEAFLSIVAKAPENYTPMFYSYKSWLDDLSGNISDKYDIWVANIDTYATQYRGWRFWQYSHKGRVSGIDGDVDLNIENLC